MTERIPFHGLIHDVININDARDACETGCGLVLRMDGYTVAATSCLACISGEVEYRRSRAASDMAKQLGPETASRYLDVLKKSRLRLP